MRRAFRIAAVAMAASLAAMGGARAEPPQSAHGVAQRIMSLDLCTDLLLLEIAPRARIASVTFLAHDATQSLFPGLDAGIPTNRGSGEDLVRVHPDLVLDSELASPFIRSLAGKMGARVVTVKDATSFADIRQVVRQVGQAVREPARAEALIQRMDAELATLATEPAPRTARGPLKVVAWSGGSAVPGQGTLTNSIIAAAGATNIAARPGASTSSFGVEELLAERPDLLLYGGAALSKPSLLSDQAEHRAVRELYAGRRIAYADAAYTCGLPQSADAARDLRRAMTAAMTREPRR